MSDSKDEPANESEAEKGLLMRHHKVDIIIVFEVAIKVIFPFLVGMAGWTYTNIIDLNNRVLRIESTRYTRADADTEYNRLKDQIGHMDREMADMRAEAKVKMEILKRLEEALKDLGKDVRELKNK